MVGSTDRRVRDVPRITDTEWLAKLARLGVTAAGIRDWAREQGLAVGCRGRLSPGLIAAYVQAHPVRTELPPALPRKKQQPKGLVVPLVVRETDWVLSDHARERARELGYMDQQILDALEEPEVTYEQPTHGDGDAIIQKGDVALGVNMLSRVVKTVLVRTTDRWEHTAEVVS